MTDTIQKSTLKQQKLVAEFKINYKKILDLDLDYCANFDKNLAIKFYQNMLLNRLFDQKIINLQRTGQMGTYASQLGQEAICTGIGYAMHKDDIYVPYYRDYGILMLRGTKMEEILAYWGGDERGNNYQNNKNDFPPCVPIATQTLHACGAAFALKYQNKSNAVLVTIGDGGTSEGDFYEAINVAGAWDLPVIFVIVNNQWAISVPRHEQTRAQTLAQKAIAAGIDSIQIDGNDVFAVYDTVNSALMNARLHKKPFVIEAITYRLADHTTADDATNYRDISEVITAKKYDPIDRFKRYLINNNLWDEAKEQEQIKDCAEKISIAVNNYLATEPAEFADMFKYLYKNPLPQYD